MKTIVIGLGNPILGDDGVGIRAVGGLGERAPSTRMVELGAGGIRLLDILAGYERTLIVDAMVTGEVPCGTIRRFSLADLQSKTARTCNTLCVHDMDLPTALALGRLAGMALPTEIVIWGIEAGEVEDFSESLSPAVEAALPIVVEAMAGELRGEKAWVTNSASTSATAARP